MGGQCIVGVERGVESDHDVAGDALDEFVYTFGSVGLSWGEEPEDGVLEFDCIVPAEQVESRFEILSSADGEVIGRKSEHEFSKMDEVFLLEID